MKGRHRTSRRSSQTGVALLALLTLLALWGLYVFVGQLNATQFQATREQNAASALAEAKQALLGGAISQFSINSAGYLSLPDLGSGYGVVTEGQASGTFSGDGKDLSVIGKFPWRTLATTPLRDLHSECLWYVVSGRIKNDTPALETDIFNWDTQGQIDIIDGSGNVIATNLAALLVAPGQALDGQNRALANPVYTQCGGNYDARNYLDAFDNANAIVGEVNYFAGSTNNRVALNTGNKRFVVTVNEHYNDRLLSITVEDIFSPLIRRSDFANAITSLLDDPGLRKQVETGHPETVAVSLGAGKEKGTYNLDCNLVANSEFCKNWKEMLFLTQLPTPSPITIDGLPSGTSCNRVLIFAGRKAVGQSRSTLAEKANKANYLEDTVPSSNASSFNVPIAASGNFGGALAFTFGTPSVDIVRCLP